MVSPKLIHQIEDHWERVSGRFFRLLRSSQELPHVASMSENELTDSCRRVLATLNLWLVSNTESGLAWTYEKVGVERWRDGIPLSELIRAMQFMKDATLGFLQEESNVENSVDVFAKEEFDNRLVRFFDLVIFHLARGYESAAQGNSRAASARSGI